MDKNLTAEEILQSFVEYVRNSEYREEAIEYFAGVNSELCEKRDAFGEKYDSEAVRQYIQQDTSVEKKEVEQLIVDFMNKPHHTEKAQWYNSSELTLLLRKSSGPRAELVEKILNTSKPQKPVLTIENEEFFDKLLATLPNFEEVINFYKGQFRQNYYGHKKRINPVLLLGDPGIGKTYFAKQLAASLNTNYAFIDMGSLSGNWMLSGLNPSWNDARQGKILDLMIKSNTFNPLIMLDELDKMHDGKYDPSAVLYQLLEEINAREFTDEFVDFSFDASGIIYIASANSTQTLSEPLISRFKVFHVPSPNHEQLNSIIANIYHNAVKENPLFEPVLNSKVLEQLKDNSLREIKIMLEEAINNLLLEYTREELDQLTQNGQTIELEERHLRSKTRKKKIGFSS